MANRIRPIDEKVKSVSIALSQINVEAAAREAGIPPSTLRYDLNKVNYHRQRRWLVMAHLKGALTTQRVAGRSWPKSRRLSSFRECPAGSGAIPAEIALLPSSRRYHSMWVCHHSCQAHSTPGDRLLGRTQNQSLGMWRAGCACIHHDASPTGRTAADTTARGSGF